MLVAGDQATRRATSRAPHYMQPCHKPDNVKYGVIILHHTPGNDNVKYGAVNCGRM